MMNQTDGDDEWGAFWTDPKAPINSGEIDITVSACVYRDGGGHEIYFDGINDPDIARFRANPDRFAADYFGFSTIAEYREWVIGGGTPGCGAVTKNGTFCKNPNGLEGHSIEEWKKNHRAAYCGIHRNHPPRENEAAKPALTIVKPE
jgi:hypothetical protein